MTTHALIPSLPLIVIFSTFVFVLSVILINKSPKAGVCLVGGLICVVPLLWHRAAMTGTFSTPMGLPFVIIPGTFLFVLLIVVLAKAPKAGTALIVLLAGMVLFGMVFGVRVARQSTALVSQMGGVPAVVPVPLPAQVIPPPSATPAPIWSASMEKEMDADIYPSKLAAIRALGSRMDQRVRNLVGDVNEAPRIILFQQEVDRALIVELKNTIGQVLPQATCRVEAEQKNLNPGEVGVTVHLTDLDMQPAPWAESGKMKAASGTIDLSVATTTGSVPLRARFVEKPWMENFATFASNRPEQAFIVARSTGTCTSESEAQQQAMWDASQQVGHIVWNRRPPSAAPANAAWISPSDLQHNGLVVDTFVQSFEGSVGKIWRQAVLLDVSSAKVTQLFRLKSGEVRRARESWARMGLSAVGVVMLIGVIYFFLNMATMGYYEWSLRIASVVLAVVGVLSILMVVR